MNVADGSGEIPRISERPVPQGKIKPTRKRKAPERSERVAERSAARMGRIAATSMLLNVVLALAVFYQSTKPAQVFMVEESEGRFYQARGPIEETDVLNTLMEKFARRYVKQRETVNHVDDKDRFLWVHENSSDAVWKQFNALMTDGGFYQAAQVNRTSWTIDIASAWQSNEGNAFVWSVEIIKTHYQKGRKRGSPNSWIFELKLGRDGRVKTPQQQLDNPGAFFVMAYTAREKEAVVKGQ